MTTTTAARPKTKRAIEETEFMAPWGIGLTDLAQRLGYTPKNLERILWRHGRNDLIRRLNANDWKNR